jgi:hypothetical protein
MNTQNQAATSSDRSRGLKAQGGDTIARVLAQMDAVGCYGDLDVSREIERWTNALRDHFAMLAIRIEHDIDAIEFATGATLNGTARHELTNVKSDLQDLLGKLVEAAGPNKF